MQNKTFVQAAVALSLTLGVSLVSASTQSLAYQQTLGTSVVVSDDLADGGAGMSTGGSAIGQMQFLLQGGGSFAAFCVEIQTGHARVADGFQAYTIGSFSVPQAKMLQGLFSSFYADLGSDLERAAFQTAVWEIVHEQSSQFNVDDGNLVFRYISETSTQAEDLAFAANVNELLQTAAQYSGPALYTVQRYGNVQFQDMVVAQPVPEPGTYALMLGGLALVAWGKRRKA